MFDRNTAKLKSLAAILMIIGDIVSLGIGIGLSILLMPLLKEDGRSFFVGIPLGVIVSAPFTLALSRIVYGFADIIENTAQSAELARMQMKAFMKEQTETGISNQKDWKADVEKEITKLQNELNLLIVDRKFVYPKTGIVLCSVAGVMMLVGAIFAYAFMSALSIGIALFGVLCFQKTPSEIEVNRNAKRALEIREEIATLKRVLNEDNRDIVLNENGTVSDSARIKLFCSHCNEQFVIGRKAVRYNNGVASVRCPNCEEKIVVEDYSEIS